MRKGIFSLICLMLSLPVFAQSEIGPEGDKLLYFFIAILAILLLLSFQILFAKKKKNSKKNPLLKRRRLKITLDKDRLYYPDILTLKIENVGNTPVDIAQPLLAFSNVWLKRKFRLKGMNNYNFYPLFLDPGKSHKLEVDINRFYKHDKSLKKFPKAKISIYDVNGKRFGSKSVFLKKTLYKW